MAGAITRYGDLRKAEPLTSVGGQSLKSHSDSVIKWSYSPSRELAAQSCAAYYIDAAPLEKSKHVPLGKWSDFPRSQVCECAPSVAPMPAVHKFSSARPLAGLSRIPIRECAHGGDARRAPVRGSTSTYLRVHACCRLCFAFFFVFFFRLSKHKYAFLSWRWACRRAGGEHNAPAQGRTRTSGPSRRPRASYPRTRPASERGRHAEALSRPARQEPGPGGGGGWGSPERPTRRPARRAVV